MPVQEKNKIEELYQTIETLKRDNARLKNSIKKETYGLVWMDVPEAFEADVENKLPILREIPDKAIVNDDGKPTHILIEGDNYHALTCLNYTHKEKIDVIYIDPPYNTGSDGFRYKDKRILDKFPDGTEVPVESPFRHSYWLSFMSKRLEHAKNLLKDTGVILISIDDNEVAQLKILCSKIFGEKNFVASIIWRGGRRNASKHISISHEYIMLFAKNLDVINKSNISWEVRKSGLEDIYKKYEELKEEHKNNYSKITAEFKKWYKELANSNPAKDHKHYCNVDKKGVYFASDISRGGGGGPKWDIKNPKTGNIVKTPSRGWAFSKKEDLEEAIKNDLIHFSEDGVPCFKRYLKENETQLLDSIFYKDRRASSKKFREIMGDDVFDFPKDHEIIKYFINALSDKNALVLDFFAGTGTTCHSVTELNNEDSGNRQSILITNNENNICTKVCHPRLEKIFNGYKNLRNKKNIKGLGHSLKYFKTEFVGEHNIKGASDKDKAELAHQAGELLAIAENTLYEQTKNKFYQFFTDRPEKGNIKQYTAVYFREELDKFDEFVEKVLAFDKQTAVYIFSWGEGEFDENFEDNNKISVKPIPQPILEIYKEIYNLG